MATAAGRFHFKQKPTDIWAVREQLALGCSVLRSGDQNWVSVSRAIKSFGEPNRPPEWFSQKNCALQYSDMLEKAETPKRKRADRSDAETPGEQIVRKLTNERIEELQKIIAEERQKYKKYKYEIEAVKAAQFDDKVKETWEQMQAEKRNKEEIARKAAEGAKNPKSAGMSRLKQKSPGLKVKVTPGSDADESMTESDVEIKVEPGSAESSLAASLTSALQGEVKPTPPASPLLSSLLNKASSVLPPVLDVQQQPPIVTKPPTTAETILDIKAEDDVDDDDIDIKLESPMDLLDTEIILPDLLDDSNDPTQLLDNIDEEDLVTPTSVTPTPSPTPTPAPTPVAVTTAASSASVPTPTTVKTEVPSSPAAGAPTLSRLLETRPLNSEQSSTSSTIKAESEVSSEPEPPPKPEETPKPCPEAAPPKEHRTGKILSPPPRKESEKETDRDFDRQDDKSDPGDRREPIKSVSSATEEEVPLSPASSIISNETDSGSVKGRQRKSRSKRGNNRRSSTRVTRGKVDEHRKEPGSNRPSDVESSDDETVKDESDDAASQLTPKPIMIPTSESIPNSPMSAGHSDTEDEKAHKLWKKSIMLVWRSAANHKYANVFLHPVTDDIAPGYHSIVYRPMDLHTIKKNIENGVIRLTSEFQRDMMLMFTNAIMYNNSDHNVYHMAVEMYNDVMLHIEQYVNTQMMVNTTPKMLRPSRRSEVLSDKEEDTKKRKAPESEGGKTKKRKA